MGAFNNDRTNPRREYYPGPSPEDVLPKRKPLPEELLGELFLKTIPNLALEGGIKAAELKGWLQELLQEKFPPTVPGMEPTYTPPATRPTPPIGPIDPNFGGNDPYTPAGGDQHIWNEDFHGYGDMGVIDAGRGTGEQELAMRKAKIAADKVVADKAAGKKESVDAAGKKESVEEGEAKEVSPLQPLTDQAEGWRGGLARILKGLSGGDLSRIQRGQVAKGLGGISSGMMLETGPGIKTFFKAGNLSMLAQAITAREVGLGEAEKIHGELDLSKRKRDLEAKRLDLYEDRNLQRFDATIAKLKAKNQRGDITMAWDSVKQAFGHDQARMFMAELSKKYLEASKPGSKTELPPGKDWDLFIINELLAKWDLDPINPVAGVAGVAGLRVPRERRDSEIEAISENIYGE